MGRVPLRRGKLAVLLPGQGYTVSTSMVGRILSAVKARGVLKESPRYATSTPAPTRAVSRLTTLSGPRGI